MTVHLTPCSADSTCYGYLHVCDGYAPSPVVVKFDESQPGNRLARFEGAWRTVHAADDRLYIVHMGERLTLVIDRV